MQRQRLSALPFCCAPQTGGKGFQKALRDRGREEAPLPGCFFGLFYSN